MEPQIFSEIIYTLGQIFSVCIAFVSGFMFFLTLDESEEDMLTSRKNIARVFLITTPIAVGGIFYEPVYEMFGLFFVVFVVALVLMGFGKLVLLAIKAAL